jgi:hypothetical protein
LVPVILPRAAHSDGAISVNGLGRDQATHAALVLGSLVIDYVLRMKMSANLNWFYIESLPFVSSSSRELLDLAWAMNSVGADFPHATDRPNVDASGRLMTRLHLDAAVAGYFGLSVGEFEHVCGRFPIYDRHAPEPLRYPMMAAEIFRTMSSDGKEGAVARATELVERRRAEGCGFGLDELWQPEGGWDQANREAREILGEAGLS